MEEIKFLFSWGIKGLKKFFKLTRIVFLVLSVYLLAISLFVFFSKRDQAQSFTNHQVLLQKNREKIYKFINDPEINSTKEGKAFIAIYRALSCSFVGEACTNNPKDADRFFKLSLFGKAADLLAFPYLHPPASGLTWVAYKLTDVGLAPKSLAAPIGGIGLNALYPLYPIWKVFRDVSYLAIVLIMLTIGFLIMLRTKINPQTVISIENSLPKIIVSLILIALSFPLAGLLIDFMNVIILLIIFLISPDNQIHLANQYLTGGFWDLFPFDFWDLSHKIGIGVTNLLPDFIYKTLNVIASIPFLLLLWSKIYKPLKDAVSNIPRGGNMIGSFIGSLGIDIKWPALVKILSVLLGVSGIIPFINASFQYNWLIILFAIMILLSFVFTVFKLFFLLLFTYIRIILFIIFSPLYMLLEAIPGKSGFSDWLKGTFIELLTFPLVVLFLLIPYLIMSVKIPSSESIWTPPFLFGLNNEAIIYLVAGGIFLMSPDLIKQIKKSLGAQKPLVGLNFRTFLFGGGALLGGAMGGIQGARSLTAFLPPDTRKKLRSVLGGKSWISQLLVPQDLGEILSGNVESATKGREKEENEE